MYTSTMESSRALPNSMKVSVCDSDSPPRVKR